MATTLPVLLLLILVVAIVAESNPDNRTFVEVIQEQDIDWSIPSHGHCDIKFSPSADGYDVKNYFNVSTIAPQQILSTAEHLVIYSRAGDLSDVTFLPHDDNVQIESFPAPIGGWLTAFHTGSSVNYFVCWQPDNRTRCMAFEPASTNVSKPLEHLVNYPIAPGTKLNGSQSIQPHMFVLDGGKFEYDHEMEPIKNTVYHFQVNNRIGLVRIETIYLNKSMVTYTFKNNGTTILNELKGVMPLSVYFQQSTNRLYAVISDGNGGYNVGWIDPFVEHTEPVLEDVRSVQGFNCDFDQFMVVGQDILIFRSSADVISINGGTINKLITGEGSDQNSSRTYLIPTTDSEHLKDSVIIYSDGKYYSFHFKSTVTDVSIMVVIGLAALLLAMVSVVIGLAIFKRKQNQRPSDEEGLIGDEVDDSVQESIAPWADQLEPRRSIVIDNGDDDEDNLKLVDHDDSEEVFKEPAAATDSILEPVTLTMAAIEHQAAEPVTEPSADKVREDKRIARRLLESDDVVSDPTLECEVSVYRDLKPMVEELKTGHVGHDVTDDNLPLTARLDQDDAKIDDEVDKNKDADETVDIKTGELTEAIKLNEEVEGLLQKELDPYIPDILANIKNDVQVNYVTDTVVDTVGNQINDQKSIKLPEEAVMDMDQQAEQKGMNVADGDQVEQINPGDNLSGNGSGSSGDGDNLSIYEEADQTMDSASSPSDSKYLSVDTLVDDIDTSELVLGMNDISEKETSAAESLLNQATVTGTNNVLELDASVTESQSGQANNGSDQGESTEPDSDQTTDHGSSSQPDGLTDTDQNGNVKDDNWPFFAKENAPADDPRPSEPEVRHDDNAVKARVPEQLTTDTTTSIPGAEGGGDEEEESREESAPVVQASESSSSPVGKKGRKGKKKRKQILM